MFSCKKVFSQESYSNVLRAMTTMKVMVATIMAATTIMIVVAMVVTAATMKIMSVDDGGNVGDNYDNDCNAMVLMVEATTIMMIID